MTLNKIIANQLQASWTSMVENYGDVCLWPDFDLRHHILILGIFLYISTFFYVAYHCLSNHTNQT